MAIVRRFELKALERHAPHRDVECTYSIISDEEGRRCLQLDTYGSNERRMPGKKSQSLRFTPEALAELKRLLAEHF